MELTSGKGTKSGERELFNVKKQKLRKEPEQN